MRALIRRWVPRAVRVEAVRLRRAPERLAERGVMARRRLSAAARADFPHTLATHRSPLLRPGTEPDPRLQAGKVQNISRVAGAIDGVVISPYQILSYHHLVGRPSRLRGFAPGLELHDGQPAAGVGGGACKVSNLLYWMALNAGMRVVERHRHALDLFPDAQRTVPFGCGATVFFSQADLRFENPLDQPVLVTLRVGEGWLWGAVRAQRDPGFLVEVVERDHRFVRDGDGWIRENRIVRRFLDRSGALIVEQEEARNRARTCYEPEL